MPGKIAVVLSVFLAMAAGRAVADDKGCLDERAARIFASFYAGANPDGGLFPAGSRKPAALSDIVLATQAITIIHENSISEKPEIPTVVTGYAELTSWLTNLYEPKHSGEFIPTLEVRTLGECKDGCCELPTSGILHNHLYLKSVCFGTDGTTPYMKKVVLYDGD
jgi:hypothetical protein